MASSEELKRRIRAFAEELQSELGEISVADDKCWLAVVEDIAAEVGDEFATAFVENQAETHCGEVDEDATAGCPNCGKPGGFRGTRQRELITRRGAANISEPEFYCTCCRKSFFPDDLIDRRGS